MREQKRTPQRPLRAMDGQRRWRFHLWRGARALEVGDLRGARRHFRAAYRQAPEEPLVCLAWGRELVRAGDPVAGEALLRQAVAEDPELRPARLELARTLGLHLGRPDEAWDILDAFEDRFGVTAAAALLRAELCLLEPPDPGRARLWLEQALSLGADDVEVRRQLARVFNAEGVAQGRLGNHAAALAALRRAAELDPGWAGPLVNSGAVLERQGDLSRAREQYQRALALEPSNPVALENLAANLRKVGGSVEAERLYQRFGLAPPRPTKPPLSGRRSSGPRPATVPRSGDDRAGAGDEGLRPTPAD